MANAQTSGSREGSNASTTDRRTLVFFVGTDPEVDPGPLRSAQHFASVAAGAGLPAELRLAARSVRNIADLPSQADGVEVSVCPRAMEQYDVSRDQVEAIDGRVRSLAEILTEVADGESVLIPITHTIDDPRSEA